MGHYHGHGAVLTKWSTDLSFSRQRLRSQSSNASRSASGMSTSDALPLGPQSMWGPDAADTLLIGTSPQPRLNYRGRMCTAAVGVPSQKLERGV